MRVMRSLVVLLLLFLVLHKTPPANSKTIIDVSWPNCGAAIPYAPKGIVGVTGGLNFRKNPCVNEEASHFKIIPIYINSGYPGKEKASVYKNSPKKCDISDEDCLAYNYGYAAAIFANNYSLLRAVPPPQIWIDVEFANSWSDSTGTNRAELTGMLDAAKKLVGDKVGFYSYPFQWGIITGDWRNGSPSWVATGRNRPIDAIEACRRSFTGGPALLGQYTAGFDQNIVCN